MINFATGVFFDQKGFEIGCFSPKFRAFLTSFAPRTELTLWKVRTEHACFDLPTKVDEFVQGSNQAGAADTFELQ